MRASLMCPDGFRLRRIFILGLALAAAFSLSSPTRAEPRTIAFQPYYRPLPPAEVYERVSVIIYFRATPSPDGSLDTSRVDFGDLAAIVREGDRAGVDVMITIASFDESVGFPNAVATPSRRSRFVAAAVDLCERRGLAGIDIDWEFPGDGDAAVATALFRDLGAALSERGLVLSADLPANNFFGRWVPDAVLDALDWANVMSYNDYYTGDPDPNHASWEKSLRHLDYWRGRGLSREKIVLGIPFYGRNSDGDAQSYSSLVANFDPPPNANEAGGYHFNGVSLVDAKARHVVDNDYGGVMVWELGHDLPIGNERSLLGAITDVIPRDAPLRFRRGDTNADGVLDIGDPVATLAVLFRGRRDPACWKAVDANDDGAVDISDALYSLAFLFLSGDRPPAPFPGCDFDPTEDELDCVGTRCL